MFGCLSACLPSCPPIPLNHRARAMKSLIESHVADATVPDKRWCVADCARAYSETQRKRDLKAAVTPLSTLTVLPTFWPHVFKSFSAVETGPPTVLPKWSISVWPTHFNLDFRVCWVSLVYSTMLFVRSNK